MIRTNRFQSSTNGPDNGAKFGRTFVEGSAGQNVSSVGKARSSGADGFVLGRVGFGTLLAVHAPGGTH